jgi:hypothetical protein
MQKFRYKVASIAVLFAGMWALDIRVHGLRLIGGAVLICVSLGLWDAGDKKTP